MAVSVVTLKTGDRVITELKEIFDEEGKDRKGICLLMEEPYILSLDGSTPQYLTEQSGMEYQVRFSKWNPYSCLLYTSPSPRDTPISRMPSSA